MRVKKYLALIFAAILATTMLTACPWDIEDDAASDSSSVPSSSSRPSHDGGGSDDNDDNDDNDDSSSAPSSPSTPDENEKVSVVNGKLIVKSGVSELKAEDIEDIKDQIKTVELTNIDVSPITFANCDKLETVTLDGVTINGHSTFAGCGNLRTVNLNNVDIENATSTFYLCRELTTVNGANMLETIPQSMFAACTSLPYIDISGATSIRLNAFGNCTSLTAVDARGVTSIGQSAFSNCDLKHIRVGANLNNIGKQAFNCNQGIAKPMELTVHCIGQQNSDLETKFSSAGNYAEDYPQYKYDCNDDCWNQIVNESQAGGPDAGNVLARYLLDLRL